MVFYLPPAALAGMEGAAACKYENVARFITFIMSLALT